MSFAFKNLILSRSSALRWNLRHLSQSSGRGGKNHSNLSKWYLLLGSGGLCVGYFALKSFKLNTNKIYALQQRKVRLSLDLGNFPVMNH